MPRKPSQQLKNLLSNGIQKFQDIPALVKPKKNFVTTILKTISIEPLHDNAVEEDESIEDDKGTFINDAPASIVLKQEPIDNDESDITIVNEFDLVKHELMEVEPSNEQKCAIKEENLPCVKNEIKTDMQNQTESKESQIPEVNKDNLKSKRSYNRRKEAKKNSHICHICSVQFKCKSYLVRHMRVHTGERPYVCDTCDKKFAQNCHLVQHMRLHTGERPYSCHICRNKSFNHRYNYKSHMRKHFGKPSHQCHICNSAFHQKGDLKRHMLSHTGEKPYSCPKCDVRFSQKCHFTKHFAVIHGKRSYICDLCKQEFDRKSDMKKHLATHTEKKPFRCHFKDCMERFDKKTHLNDHVRSHKGAKPFACDMCKLTYRQKGHLTKHIITIHDNPLTVLRKPIKILQLNQDKSILKEEQCLHKEDNVEYIIP